jgi:hypothetical protein
MAMVQKRTVHKIISFRIAACVLCLMIVVGTLDKLPDPPALSPQGSGNTLVSQLDTKISVPVRNNNSDCLARLAHFQASLFSFGQIFESKRPSFKMNFVRRAIDSSPPRSS